MGKLSSMSFGLIFRRVYIQKWTRVVQTATKTMELWSKTGENERTSASAPPKCFYFYFSIFCFKCFYFSYYIYIYIMFFIFSIVIYTYIYIYLAFLSFGRQLKENPAGYPQEKMFPLFFEMYCYIYNICWLFFHSFH